MTPRSFSAIAYKPKSGMKWHLLDNSRQVTICGLSRMSYEIRKSDIYDEQFCIAAILESQEICCKCKPHWIFKMTTRRLLK